MLILTRKLKQGIIVNGDTSIRVLAIERDRVKLGIEAPRSISVLREELLEQVVGQNRQAARPGEGAQLVDRFRSIHNDSGAPPQQPPDGPPPAS
jgi:carbon storage regulator